MAKAIDKTRPDDLDPECETAKPESTLGMTIAGSAEDGHTVKLHQHDALLKIFGTDCKEQAGSLFTHSLKVLNDGEAGDLGEANDDRAFMASVVNDIAPRDVIERMLAVQMAATHVAMIRSGRQLAYSKVLPQVQGHNAAFNKLARTFTAQMEALRKHRTGGKQTVVVQHVNVEGGGQAIVGNVRHGGVGDDE